MSFVKRSLVVILAYIAASFVAGLAWIVFALLGGAGIVQSSGAFDLVTMTGFIALFAGLGALAAILLAEWQGLGSYLYYGIAGIVVAIFTTEWFARGAFEPAGVTDFLKFAFCGALGGLMFHVLARAPAPARSV